MNKESCRCCQEDTTLLGGKLENIECVTQNVDFAILCLSKLVLATACIRTRRYNKKFRDISIFTNFIWNSGVFDLSHVSLSEHRCQDPRYASASLLLLIYQHKYAGWVLICATSVWNWISVERFKTSITGLLPITLNASFGDIQLLRYRKMPKIWTRPLHLLVLI